MRQDEEDLCGRSIWRAITSLQELEFAAQTSTHFINPPTAHEEEPTIGFLNLMSPWECDYRSLCRHGSRLIISRGSGSLLDYFDTAILSVDFWSRQEDARCTYNSMIVQSGTRRQQV